MEAEILSIPPISGDYEEHNFSDSGNTVWIKFSDDEWVEWCGVFSLGWKSFSSVHRIPEQPIFLVVAGGQGYYVDVNARKVVDTTDWDDVEAIIYSEEIKAFIVSDGLRVGVIKNGKLMWSSDRISLDGITFLNSSGPIVEGVLNDCTDEGCKFKFNVVTEEIESPWLFHQNVS